MEEFLMRCHYAQGWVASIGGPPKFLQSKIWGKRAAGGTRPQSPISLKLAALENFSRHGD